MSQARLSACMLIFHKGHTDTIQVYSVTVMTHAKALQAGHSSQGTSEPITPVCMLCNVMLILEIYYLSISIYLSIYLSIYHCLFNTACQVVIQLI